MIEVRQARYVRDYVLHLVFDDGLEGEVDLSVYLQRGPVFSPLAEPSYFRRFSLEGGTVAWPNGADIAPERLYELTEAANRHPHHRACGSVHDGPDPTADKSE